MELREQKGLLIATTKRLGKRGGLWIVPSQSGHGSYAVDVADHNCTCPDWETNRAKCKHQWAVEWTLKREVDARGVETVTETVTLTRKTYKPDEGWPLYNLMSKHRKKRLRQILHVACKGVSRTQPIRKGPGRKGAPIGDILFAGLVKFIEGTSGRYGASDTQKLYEEGLIARPFSYSYLLERWEQEALTDKLEGLVQDLARPLASFDNCVAIDSSGFATTLYSGWFDHKYGTRGGKKIFVKAHVAVAVNTHAVVGARVTESVGEGTGDPSQFKDLLDDACRVAPFKVVVADAAYSSDYSNLDAAKTRNITPYIPFRTNATGADGSDFVKQCLHYFLAKNPEFKQHAA